MTFKVLIAEDAPDVAMVLAFGVRRTWLGCKVTIAASGTEALNAFETEPPDLVLLDVEMPAPDGFEVCRHIREHSTVPIMMLTVRYSILDKVRALDLGADDYLTKPFDHLELAARLRALVRRASNSSQNGAPPLLPPFVRDDFSLDFATEEVRIKGLVVPLTAIEYRLLAELVRHAGSVMSHRVLLERVWGPEYIDDTTYLKVFIGRLRSKLGDTAEHSHYIQTVWGTGYRFAGPG